MRVVGGTYASLPYRLVWHVPRCKALDHIHWVDDETNEYAQFDVPIRFDWATGEAAEKIHKVKKIELRPKQGVVLIDPIEGLEPETTEITEVKDAITST